MRQGGDVLANLDRLVIKPLSRDAGTSTRFGCLLSASERDELAARVLAALRDRADAGATVVIAAHDPQVLATADEVLEVARA